MNDFVIPSLEADESWEKDSREKLYISLSNGLWQFYTQNKIRRFDAFMESQVKYNSSISKRVAQLEKKSNSSAKIGLNQNADSLIHYDKLSEAINALYGLDDLIKQFQYSTLVLKEIDSIFELYSSEQDKYRKQFILKLRSALKLNSSKKIFTDEQVGLLSRAAMLLREPTVGKKDVLMFLADLEDSDLSPFPQLEDSE